MVDVKDIEKLMTLFRGSRKAHGVYIEQVNNDPLKKKVKGRAMTSSLPPTLKLWKQHVDGETGLGIIPINEENKCWWGVLDIDGEVDHVKLQRNIQANHLPLVVCYSKSKSAHCFLFLEEAVPAESIRAILEEMASKLGAAGCEIFPKQNTLNIEKGDLGNWLNMPYYANTRKGVLLVGDELHEQELDEFLAYAYSKRLSAEQWNELIGHLRKQVESLDEILEGAPPCIQYILKTQGIPEGGRNKLMYNIAIYCKKRYSDNEWQDKIKEIHDKYADDPLPIKELNTIIASVEGKEYRYQCKDGMLKQFCNASVCIERENGIDFSSEIKTIKQATRILTTPPIYAVEVEMEADRPSKVYVTTDQLFKQDLFRKACSEQLHKTFIPVSMKQWNEISTNIINTAINQEPPFDMTESSALYFGLIDYLVNRMRPDKRCLVDDEGVWLNEADDQIYFKINGLREYYIRKGVVSKDTNVWSVSSKLMGIEIPTDEADITTGKSVKRKLNFGSKNVRVAGKVEYLRSIDKSEIPISTGITEVVEEIL